MTLFPHNCTKHGHRYEARFEEMPIKDSFAGHFTAQELRDLTYYKHYVRDVCTRCGHVIERK